MKRFWITLLAAAMALVIALPAGAGPPDPCTEGSPNYNSDHAKCSTTPTTPPAPEFEPCNFFIDGVLDGWEGKSVYRCIWEERGNTDLFAFEIRAQTSATQVLIPHLVVLGFQDPESDRDVCFNEHQTGPQDLPYPQDERWTFSLDECAANYLVVLEISVQKVKTGSVNLVWTNMPS